MRKSDRKSRMVTFRLSGEEYQAAVNNCRAQGFRNLSMFARSALLRFEPSENEANPEGTGIHDIRERLESLSSEIKAVSAALAARSDSSGPPVVQSRQHEHDSNGFASVARASSGVEIQAAAAASPAPARE